MGVRAKTVHAPPSWYWRERMSPEAQRGAGPKVGERGASPDGYYMSAIEKSGEPPGIWIGEGLAELGIHDGQTVDMKDFEPLYGAWRDPRDPSGQTRLGARPRGEAKVQDIYQRKLAAERGATLDRRRALMKEARAEVSGPGVLAFDNTFTVDKATTLAHAEAMAAAAEARQARDLAAAARWDERADSVWAEIMTAARLYVGHIQSEARQVKTGHHINIRMGDHKTTAGRREDSCEIPCAVFPHHTNRNGEPHLHLHIVWLNRVQTVRDGRWRSIDSASIYRSQGAGAALAAAALESGLAARHRFEWVYDAKSKGRVIKGVSRKLVEAFSTRTADLSAEARAMADAFKAEHGYDPSPQQMRSMSDYAQKITRPEKPEHAPDPAYVLRMWNAQSRIAEGHTLAQLAHKLWEGVHGKSRELTPEQEHAMMEAGIQQAQQKSCGWGRQQLIHCIGEHMPDGVVMESQQAAWRKLEELADRALAGEAGVEIVPLHAPEYPHVPDSLRRANGESQWWPHGAELYATRAQLALEEELVHNAQLQGAPFIDPDVCVKLLGTDLAHLDAAELARDARTDTGLRLDQALAAHTMLTSRRAVEVGVGPAGVGKSYTAGKMAEAWRAAGLGKVIGVTPTSNTRNRLAEASAAWSNCWNLAQILGHDEREGRGYWGFRQPLSPGDLVILDETQLAAMDDVADLVRHVVRCGAVLRVFGDHAQLGAPEGGGAFPMLLRKLGHVQLTEAVRFREQWEAEASLAIRDGDASALAAYDDHARLHGGASFEEQAEKASRHWLAEHMAGTHVAFNVYSNAEAADLSRRVQSYLREWGMVGGRSIALRDGNRAHAGDMIIARKNDPRIPAGEAGRPIINSDMLKITRICSDGVIIARRAVDGGGWSEQFDISAAYGVSNCDLGYARTTSTVTGLTTEVNIGVSSDQRARQGLYPSITRGRENHLYTYEAGGDGEHADHRHHGELELERQRMLEADRTGAAHEHEIDTADPLSAAAAILRNHEEQLSATEIRERALADADHLGRLWGQWQELTRRESSQRFTRALRDTLTPAEADKVLEDTDDLWRSLRSAELAGRDGPEVLRQAIAQRGFQGARSMSAVLNGRVRKATGNLVPLVRESWASMIPQDVSPEIRQYLTSLAEAMDNREARLGEHAAATTPVWAIQALGDVPGDPAQQASWQEDAGKLWAHREMTGWHDPGRALGGEPGSTAPEMNAEYHRALAALAKIDGIEVRGLSDGTLLAQRRAFEQETARAPKYVAEQLRLARRQEGHSRREAIRHRQESAAAARRGQTGRAGLHERLADSHLALQERATQLGEILAGAQDTRQQWEADFEPTRRIAVAADAEARRRGLVGPEDHLVSREPEGFTYVQDRLDGGSEPAGKTDPVKQRGEREEAGYRTLGLTLGNDQPQLPFQVRDIAEYNRARQAELDERRSQMVPAEDPDLMDLRPAWTQIITRDRSAVIQPPAPEIPPAQKVMELDAQREGA